MSLTKHEVVNDWLFTLMGFLSPSQGSATFTSTTRWPWSSTHGWTWWSSPSGGALFRMSPANICTLHPIWFSVSKWNHINNQALEFTILVPIASLLQNPMHIFHQGANKKIPNWWPLPWTAVHPSGVCKSSSNTRWVPLHEGLNTTQHR